MIKKILLPLYLFFTATTTLAQLERYAYIHEKLVPLHSSEIVPANEDKAIKDSVRIMKQHFKNEYQAPVIDDRSDLKIEGSRRGVHPRSHACLKGQFSISHHLPERLQSGIFQNGKQYEVITRFSNARPRGESNDKTGDSRGLGIKVLGVEGETVLNQQGPISQDFTLNSADSFFATDAHDYARFMRMATVDSPSFVEGIKNYVLTLFKEGQLAKTYRVAKAFSAIQSVKATSLFGIEYFSISAFQNGKGSNAPIVKYILKPCQGKFDVPADLNDAHFLRKNLVDHISNKDACFSFYIQERTHDNLEVEDLTKPWSERISPPIFVGRLILPQQDLMDEVACEKLVINSWNSLKEHKPVGGINRLRLAAYLASIELRKDAVVNKK